MWTTHRSDRIAQISLLDAQIQARRLSSISSLGFPARFCICLQALPGNLSDSTMLDPSSSFEGRARELLGDSCRMDCKQLVHSPHIGGGLLLVVSTLWHFYTATPSHTITLPYRVCFAVYPSVNHVRYTRGDLISF